MKKLLLSFILALCAIPTFATTYYVDNCSVLGSDSNNGTSATTPWLTVSKVVASSFSAGDGVLFRRGCIWHEQLSFPSAGATNNPIIVSAYGAGEKPQFDAADPVGAWTTNTASYDFTFNASAGIPGNFTSVTDSGTNLSTVTNPNGDGTTVYQLAPPSSANHYLEKTGLSYTSSLYSAFWVRFGTGFNYQTFDLSQIRTASGTFLGIEGNTNNGFPAITWNHGSPGFVNDIQNFPLPFNQWVLIESTATGIGTASGVYTGYVNGQRAFQTTGIDWSAGYTITTERLGMIQRFGTSAAGNVYLSTGWTNVNTTGGAPNTWKATVTTAPKVVLFGGAHGTGKGTQGSLVSPGDWTWASNTLYAYGTVAPSSTYATIEAGARDFAVLNDSKNWVTYDNLDLRNANQFAIRFQNTAHGTVQNSNLYQSALGGANVNNGGGQTSSFITYDRNDVWGNGGTGLDVNCGGCGAITIANVLITNNRVRDNGWNPDNTTGYINTTGGIKVFGTQTTSVSILDNYVTGQLYTYLNPTSAGDVISGAGIWLDTIGTSTIAEFNQACNNRGYGVVTEATNVSPAPIMAYNVACSNYGGIGVNRGTHNALVYGNTTYGNTNCGLCNEGVGAQTDQVGNLFKNNIASGNLYNLSAILGGENAGGGSANVYDHNNLGAPASNFVQWGFGTFKSTYAALDSAYGSSTNSVQTDPAFVSAAAGDFRLLKTSPDIDSGLNLGSTFPLGLSPRNGFPFINANQNSYGTGWDIGAFVFVGSN